MNEPIERLAAQALGLQAPWDVARVDVHAARKRVDFEIACHPERLNCPNCGASQQPRQGSIRRSWRHLDANEFESWLHAAVPRVACSACGRAHQLPVPWAREGSGFTLAFEALAQSLYQDLPVRQAALRLRAHDRPLGRTGPAPGRFERASPEPAAPWLEGVADTGERQPRLDGAIVSGQAAAPDTQIAAERPARRETVQGGANGTIVQQLRRAAARLGERLQSAKPRQAQ